MVVAQDRWSLTAGKNITYKTCHENHDILRQLVRLSRSLHTGTTVQLILLNFVFSENGTGRYIQVSLYIL